MELHPFLQENFIPLSDCKVALIPRGSASISGEDENILPCSVMN